MSERPLFIAVKSLFNRHRRAGEGSEPKAVKPMVVGEGDNKTILISAERIAEIHKESLKEADRIIEDRIRDEGGSLWWVGFAAECLITGGHPTALNPHKRK